MKTIHDRIRDVIAASGLTLKDFAAKIGLPKRTLTNYRDGISRPPSDVLERICRTFNVRPEWLLTGEGPIKRGKPSDPGERHDADGPDPEEFTFVPKVSAILNAGHGSWITEDRVLAFYAFRKDWIKLVGQPSSMVLMEVQGDSMHPTLHPGDHLLIDTSQTTPRQGAIMAVGIDDSVLVKRINITPEHLELISDNR
ncbi:Helix-turn-helix, partial [Desulfacinum hydrothermale DSM 13146]